MSKEKDEVQFTEMHVNSTTCVGHAHLMPDGLMLHQVGKQPLHGIFIEANNVLSLRDFCNSWMMRYGARDTQGRLVFDEATERE